MLNKAISCSGPHKRSIICCANTCFPNAGIRAQSHSERCWERRQGGSLSDALAAGIEGAERGPWVIILRLLTSGWHWCEGCALFFCLYCSAVAQIWLLHQHLKWTQQGAALSCKAFSSAVFLCVCVCVLLLFMPILYSFCMLPMHVQGVLLKWSGRRLLSKTILSQSYRASCRSSTVQD